MSEITRESDHTLDALVEEVSHFVSFYLGNDVNLDEIIGHVLKNFATVVPPKQGLRNAMFFKELEKVCLQQKMQSFQCGDRQLELFPDHRVSAFEKDQEIMEIMVCRARSFLVQWDHLKYPIKKADSTFDKENFTALIFTFCCKLSQEKFIEDGRFSEEVNLFRLQKIVEYLLELLSDPNSIEVEKKCRENPEWQGEKIWVSKVIAQLQLALKSENGHGLERSKFLGSKNKLLLESWFLATRKETVKANFAPKLDLEEKVPNRLSKEDNQIWAFLIIGLIAFLVSYLGWLEFEKKKAERVNFSKNIEANQWSGKKENLNLDSLTQMALLRAHETAKNVLNEQTISTLRKIENRLEVPDQLMPQLSQSDMNQTLIINHNSDLGKSSITKINKKAVEDALRQDSGYIFLPGRESLGRIIEVKHRDGAIHFKRADWQNPKASFGLLVSDYEIRLGSDNIGFVIILGEVRREKTNINTEKSLPVYQMIPSNSWWLDQNQTRTKLELKEILIE